MKKTFILITSLIFFSFTTTNDYGSQEDYGRASDCAQVARSVVLEAANIAGQDPNGANFDFYIGLYHLLYRQCYDN
jgi:hypothetical protein